MIRPPEYFEEIRTHAAERWQRLENDPELAAPWHQLFKQVQSPRHVVSELLQNADDARATKARIDLIDDNKFTFSHNGEDFTKEHFASLCRFGYSNKRSLHTIGFRGIGFKSIFSLGNTVYLGTQTLSVKFNESHFTEPIWVEQENNHKFTVIHVKIKNSYCKQELEKNLNQWLSSPSSLLFFRNIKSLNINGRDVCWEDIGPGPVAGSTWMRLSSEPGKKFLLIRSEEELFPSDALAEIQRERMLHVDDEAIFPPCRVEIVLDLPGKLYVILPTGVTTKLPFACNAPFVQDPARLKIKEPNISPTNRWLLRRIGKLAAESMLAWLNNTDLSIEDRAVAYDFLPDMDYEETSLEGICAQIVEKEIINIIHSTKCILKENGNLCKFYNNAAVPDIIHDIWEPEYIIKYIIDNKNLISPYISDKNQKKLSKLNAITVLKKEDFTNILKKESLPRPKNWKRLMLLWGYIADTVNISKYYNYNKNEDIRVVPVQGSNALHASNTVTRITEKQFLLSEEDSEFLYNYLLILDRNWIVFLDEYQKNIATGRYNKGEQIIVEQAFELLEKLNLTKSTDVTHLIPNMAKRFFINKRHNTKDYIRIAQIAAHLNADVSKLFQYINQEGNIIDILYDGVLVDIDKDLDLFIEQEWLNKYILHEDYNVMLSCEQKTWQQWISSTRSGLLGFAPLKSIDMDIWWRNKIEEFVKNRGYHEQLLYCYRTERFKVIDIDFAQEHWQHWEILSKNSTEFWGKLFSKILKQPASFWKDKLSAKVLHISTNNTSRQISSENLLPKWILKFRTLPCLQDTHGTFRIPAELFRRTPETETLLDIEPFVRAEYDTELFRPLLIALGLRDTPTGPDKLLDRLRALSQVKDSSSVPVSEIEKWYHKLDQLMNNCSTEDIQQIREAFNKESLVFSANYGWCKLSEVFLEPDDDEAPSVATLPTSFRHFTLWRKVGMAEQPTCEILIKWLGTLESGKTLSPKETHRVRSVLSRYPERIWNECEHWLNLEEEWVPTKNLIYFVSSNSLIFFDNLYKNIKQNTADLRKIHSEKLLTPPFSKLKSLDRCIKNQIDHSLQINSSAQSRVWIKNFGTALKRVVFDNPEESSRINELASRLTKTSWKSIPNLKIIPYINGIPVGMPHKTDAFWDNFSLFVTGKPSAKMLRPVIEALGQVFGRTDITEALRSCYERNEEFISEYFEENFETLKEEIKNGVDKILYESAQSSDNKNISSSFNNEKNILDNSILSEEENRYDDNDDNNLQYDNEEYKNNSELEHQNIYKQESKNKTSKKLQNDVHKLSLFEYFALKHGFTKDPSGHRFSQKNTGESIQRTSDSCFQWVRYSSEGEIIKYYWAKEICLESQALTIDAAVWNLCIEHPLKYSLILADINGKPVEYSGERINLLVKDNKLRVYTADYRITSQSTDGRLNSLT